MQAAASEGLAGARLALKVLHEVRERGRLRIVGDLRGAVAVVQLHHLLLLLLHEVPPASAPQWLS